MSETTTEPVCTAEKGCPNPPLGDVPYCGTHDAAYWKWAAEIEYGKGADPYPRYLS